MIEENIMRKIRNLAITAAITGGAVLVQAQAALAGSAWK